MANEIVNYDEIYARDAQQYADQERYGGGKFINTRGGIMSFEGEVLPGSQMCAIVLHSIQENVYYPDKWDPENPLPPRCYAMGAPGAELAPHESMQASAFFEPQAEECNVCKFHERGTSEFGTGSACKPKRRLAVIPAGYYVPKKGSRDFDLNLYDTPEHFRTADMAFISVPTTSVKYWGKYLEQIRSAHRKPPYAVFTRIYVEPDSKNQIAVRFEMLEEVPNELAAAIIGRHEEAKTAIIFGHAPPREQEAKAAQPRGLRGLRK